MTFRDLFEYTMSLSYDGWIDIIVGMMSLSFSILLWGIIIYLIVRWYKKRKAKKKSKN